MTFARTSVLIGACVSSFLAALAPGCATGTTGTVGSGGAGTTATSTPPTGTGGAGTGGAGGATACVPGATRACYTGPAGTEGVGLCKAGQQTCAADGSGFGACLHEVLPAPAEDCATPVDDDCNGQINEASAGCVCDPASTVACYDGPAGTEGVGLCHAGTKTCAADGKSYGACLGEVLPVPESCSTPGDDNCDGTANEGCVVCSAGMTQECYDGPAGTEGVSPCRGGTRTCNAQGTGFGACMGEVVPTASVTCTASVTYAGDVQPIFAALCAPCHTSLDDGGADFATSYAQSQLGSAICAGKTVGACTIVRIQSGSMPKGAGCTGDPATDSGDAACLTAAQEATIEAWIAGGQKP